jgi:hypothetical protein
MIIIIRGRTVSGPNSIGAKLFFSCPEHVLKGSLPGSIFKKSLPELQKVQQFDHVWTFVVSLVELFGGSTF